MCTHLVGTALLSRTFRKLQMLPELMDAGDDERLSLGFALR